MKRATAVLLGSLMLAPTIVFTMPAVAQTVPATLQDGTPIKLRLGRNLSSADAHTGDTVDFEVLEEVRVNNIVVIPRGATALATITNAEAKRRMGRAGKLDVNIDSVRLADGEKVPLRGVRNTSGGGHTGAMTGAMVATSLVAWPAAPLFLLMHGKDVTIPEGTQITAYINGDIPIELSRFSGRGLTASGSPAMQQANLVRTVGATSSANITSSVPGADVTVDGNYVGSTPAQLELTPGEHTINVKKRGYRVWTRQLQVTGATININADLEPAAHK
jgi:PEGA domain